MRNEFTKKTRILLALTAILIFQISIAAQTTAFSYQGKLNDGGTAANGSYEMQFKLFDALAGGAQIGDTFTDKSVAVINGIFTTTLDFDAAPFDGGAARYLEISVRPAGGADPFTVLSPRATVNASPFAIQARNALTADNSTNSLQLGGIDASEYVTTTTVGSSFIKNDTVPQTGNFNITGNGIVGASVGVGVVPQAGFRLDVNGAAVFRMLGSGGNLQLGTPAGETGITIGSTNRADIRFDGGSLKLFASTSGIPTNGLAVTTAGIVGTSGNLGVGTFAPDTRLTLNGGPTWTSNGWTASMNLRNGASIAWDANASGRRWGIGQSGGGLYVFRSFSSFGTTASPADYAMVITDAGNVGIGTTIPTAKLEISGTVKTNILQITGGSDLAENFEFGEAVKPGMVVAIDPRRTGKLILARGAYNRTVAGIISGANDLAAGMILPDLKDTKNSMPVALSGRVWVYADAARNPIKPGDLLTTSATPGFAMKVVNYKKAQGAIIGKALTELKSGTGLVLVLVSLQ